MNRGNQLSTRLNFTLFLVLAILGDRWDPAAATRAACYPRAVERKNRRAPAS